MKQITQVASQATSTLLKRRVLTFGSAAVLLVISVSGVVYAAMQNSTPPTLTQTGQEKSASEESATLTTIQPSLVSGSSSVILLGSVLSHETANIYPRRDGIVEDVYVDIGDSVKKGQIVAILLPKGVEGQSVAMIAEKQARKAQAETDLSTTKQVANETLISTRQKINEKETELLIAEREQESIIQKFTESEANVSQMQEQTFTAVQNARQLIEWITLGSNSRSSVTIDDKDIMNILGIQDSSNTARYDIVYQFNTLYSAEQEYLNTANSKKATMIDSLLPLALNALGTTNTLLQYTPTQPSANGISQLSHQQLTDRLNKVVSAQDMIYKAKEKLEDARNSFQTLVASEPDLYRAYRSGNYDSVQSNKVRMLEEQIRTANNNLALTEANQEQMVEMKKRQVDIAAAMLQSEYAQSGHRQIQSPFTGIISKRFVDVGQIVMPSMPAFELTNVPTSLAKKAKAEIQFGLPENLLSAIEVGDRVTFFLQTDESKQFTAEVTRKSPQVDMTTRTVTVQAKVPDDLNLPHQASVRIRLVDEKKPVFRLPSSAVKRAKDQNYIWVLDTKLQKPMKHLVSVIAEDGEFAELTGDITVNSKVILDPPDLFLMQDDD